MKTEIWNRCDYCGRFIGIEEFADGVAERHFYLTSMGEHYIEEYETYHVKCKEEESRDGKQGAD